MKTNLTGKRIRFILWCRGHCDGCKLP